MILTLLFLTSRLWLNSPAADCRITFNNLQEARGSLYVAVYAQEGDFLNEKRFFTQKIVPVQQAGVMELNFSGLPPGQYAVSCFHDVNGNGKLDTNMVGIPNEPYGFSNNARPKFRAPRWYEAVFSLGNSGGSQQIRLEKW